MCAGMGTICCDMSDIEAEYGRIDRMIRYENALQPAFARRRRCDRRVKRTDDSVNVQVKQTETKGN